MKFLLVSDLAPFSTFDVFMGYINAFNNLKVPFEVFNIPMMSGVGNTGAQLSWDIVWATLLGKLHLKKNGFTHVIYIGGHAQEQDVMESKGDKKLVIIATDDPQASKSTLRVKESIDYYFCNERTMDKMYPFMHYIPTAVSDESIAMDKDVGNKNYESDICFVGSVYPDRVKPLEAVAMWCKENGKKFNLIGPAGTGGAYAKGFIPDGSILLDVIQDTLIPNKEANKYYANAKVCLNLDRNVFWHPLTTENGDGLDLGKEVESMNPRLYEVASCKSLQYCIGPRKEAIDIFGNNIVVSDKDEGSIESTLDKIFKMNSRVVKRMVDKCYDIVLDGHTYTHRAADILKCLIKY